jgi:uncharacterized protein YcaQ
VLSGGLTTISKTTARRFVLGRQGLWPGRRWSGKEGVAEAIRACEAVQMDPLVVVARSHDIALLSRVLDYRPEHLETVMYTERRFFDYGGSLYVYPMSEVPYWRVHMLRRGEWGRYANDRMGEYQEALDFVRQELRTRGPLTNRSLDGSRRVQNYRGRKDTAVALYALWIPGEVMVHHRERFERVYDFTGNILPPEYDATATEDEARAYFGCKNLAFHGMMRERPWAASISGDILRPIDKQEGKRMLEERIDAGEITPLSVETSKDTYYVLSQDLPLLDLLEQGNLPDGWLPAGPSTLDEVTFLAPLDIVSARGRSKWLFDFDYIWEVYKPAHLRRWGYYTLPVLYGDRLVARLDPRLERPTSTLKLEGFWLEDGFQADAAFAAALARGLLRFARFLGAEKLNLAVIQPSSLRDAIAAALAEDLEVQAVPDS